MEQGIVTNIDGQCVTIMPLSGPATTLTRYQSRVPLQASLSDVMGPSGALPLTVGDTVQFLRAPSDGGGIYMATHVAIVQKSPSPALSNLDNSDPRSWPGGTGSGIIVSCPGVNGHANAAFTPVMAVATNPLGQPIAVTWAGLMLPAGVAVSSAGVISGTLASGGIFYAIVAATDANGNVGTGVVGINIQS